jgi:small subunit ribosomal protein S16
VISENSKPPQSRALEILGYYDPHSKDLQVKEDRVKHWLRNGSTISPSANNLLVSQGILESEKKKTIKLKNKKREELKKQSEEKQKAAEPVEVKEDDSKQEVSESETDESSTSASAEKEQDKS